MSEERPDVWADVIGQSPAVAQLRQAVDGACAALQGGDPRGMTHAWLITGPPGSGRSVAARAFAAALQCGCGHCNVCRSVLAGTHPDVTLVRIEGLSIKVDDVRELVRRAAMSPTGDRWQILVVEDADRLTEKAADALLKALEEPARRTVWVLCAPTADDVVPTIRSRCRLLVLRTPPVEAVAEVLVRRDGVDPAMAAFAAAASQGHVGRASALATQADVRRRRREVLTAASSLRDLGSCLRAAASLEEVAAEESREMAAAVDAQERSDLEAAYGVSQPGRRGAGPARREAQTALKDLTERQKVRAKRLKRDCLDRALVDMMSLYRDVLALQLRATRTPLINAEMIPDIEALAARTRPDDTVRRIDVVHATRQSLVENVAPLLALEAMMVRLVDPAGP